MTAANLVTLDDLDALLAGLGVEHKNAQARPTEATTPVALTTREREDLASIAARSDAFTPALDVFASYTPYPRDRLANFSDPAGALPAPPAIDLPELAEPVEPETAPTVDASGGANSTCAPNGPTIADAVCAPPPPRTPALSAGSGADPTAVQEYRRMRGVLVHEALTADILAVRRIRDHLDSDDADFDDAIKAASILHKRIEHVEKLAATYSAQHKAPPVVYVDFAESIDGAQFSLSFGAPTTAPTHTTEIHDD